MNETSIQSIIFEANQTLLQSQSNTGVKLCVSYFGAEYPQKHWWLWMPYYLMGSNLFWMCTGSIHSACSDSLSLCSRVFSFPPNEIHVINISVFKFSLLVSYQILLTIKYMFWYPVSCDLQMNLWNLISRYAYFFSKFLK